MITAITAIMSVILGCAIVVIIQLALVAYHLDCLKSYTRTQIALLQKINDKLAAPAEMTADDTVMVGATLSDEQTFHNAVMALNDFRRTGKENPRYTTCKSVAMAWVNAAYERLR